jgi:uncharacterized protein (DUF1697 family)
MVLVSMLRGVNLGPHHRMRMADLKAVYESLGLTEVETYIQSGNVVFRSAARKPAAVSAQIEAAIRKRFGFEAPVVVRSAAEMRSVVARNPFAGRAGIDPARLAVHFLYSRPDGAASGRLRALPPAPEEMKLDGCELYVHYVNGMARPTISMTQVGKAVGVEGTARNWNTVEKLLEMAEGLEKAR